MNNILTTQKTFLSILLRAIVYLVLVFTIIYSVFFSYTEFLIYKFVIPLPPIYEEKIESTPVFTASEKEEIVNYVNYTNDSANSDDVARELKAIPKSKTNISDEEKDNILKKL